MSFSILSFSFQSSLNFDFCITAFNLSYTNLTMLILSGNYYHPVTYGCIILHRVYMAKKKLIEWLSERPCFDINLKWSI